MVCRIPWHEKLYEKEDKRMELLKSENLKVQLEIGQMRGKYEGQQKKSGLREDPKIEKGHIKQKKMHVTE